METELTAILKEFYQCADATRIYILNQKLVKFQQSFEAWEVAWNLLQSAEDDTVLFFCGNTLAQKIRTKIRELDKEKQIGLRDALFTYLKERASQQNFSRVVLSSVVSCFVQLILALTPDLWPHPVTFLLEKMHLENDPDRSKEVILVLNALEFLADSYQNYKELKTRLMAIHHSLAEDSDKLVAYCTNVLLHNWSRPEVYNACLSCASAWCQALRADFINHDAFMSRSFDAAMEPQLSDKAVDFLTVAFETLGGEKSTLPFFHRLTQMLPTLKEGLLMQDSDTINMYTRIYSGVVESKPETLWFPMLNQQINHGQEVGLSMDAAQSLMQALIECVKAGGLRYPSEETSSMMAINVCYSLTEAYEELTDQYHTAITPQWTQTFDSLFAQFVAAVIPKIAYPAPPEEPLDPESLDNFLTYRADVMDVLNAMHTCENNAGGVLRLLVEELEKQMQPLLSSCENRNDATGRVAWQIVEAIIHVVSNGLFTDFFDLYEGNAVNDEDYDDEDDISNHHPGHNNGNNGSTPMSELERLIDDSGPNHGGGNSGGTGGIIATELHKSHSRRYNVPNMDIHTPLCRFFQMMLQIPGEVLLQQPYLAEAVYLAYCDYSFFLTREPTLFKTVMEKILWTLSNALNSQHSTENSASTASPKQMRLFAVKVLAALVKDHSWQDCVPVDIVMHHLTQQFEHVFNEIKSTRAINNNPNAEERQFCKELFCALGYITSRVGKSPLVMNLYFSVLAEIANLVCQYFDAYHQHLNIATSAAGGGGGAIIDRNSLTPSNNTLNTVLPTTAPPPLLDLSVLSFGMDGLRSLLVSVVGLRNASALSQNPWLIQACDQLLQQWIRCFRHLLSCNMKSVSGPPLQQVQVFHDFLNNISHVQHKICGLIPHHSTMINCLTEALALLSNNLYYLDSLTRLVTSFDLDNRPLPQNMLMLCVSLLDTMRSNYFLEYSYPSACAHAYLAGLYTACMSTLLSSRSIVNLPKERVIQDFRFALFSFSFNLPHTSDTPFKDCLTFVMAFHNHLKRHEEGNTTTLDATDQLQLHYVNLLNLLLTEHWVLLNAMILLGASISGRQGIGTLRVTKTLSTLFKMQPRRQQEALRWLFSDASKETSTSAPHDQQTEEVRRLFNNLDRAAVTIILNGLLSRNKDDVSCALDTLTNAYHTWFLSNLPIM